MVDRIAFQYTNYMLEQQKDKVLNVVERDGVDYYLQGNESVGTYTLLKEEFISIEPIPLNQNNIDTITTAQRKVEQDTLTYRILSHTFTVDNQKYLLEVGKTTAAIGQYNRPLQRIALMVLLSLIGVTLIIDLLFTHFLLKPLGLIIKSKLVNQRFPFAKNFKPIKTTTSDFTYLDTSLMLLMEQINDAFEKEREFTANASHELMTPISILQNKIENLMEHAEASDLIQQKLTEMLRSLARLKKIVNSLLLISRIENEQFAKSDTLKVEVLVNEVMEEIGHRLEEQEISFSMKFDKKFFIKNVNHDLLFQLFFNLVNNAIRYNKPKGSIFIYEEFDNGVYAVNIKDTGLGIPESDLAFIFNRFRKANLSQTGGYGLGLSIVKSIASYHGIKLEVSSVENEETTFSVIFPPDSIILNYEA